MNEKMQRVCDVMAYKACLNSLNINWKDGSHIQLDWTEKQENDFKEYLIDALLHDKELRNEMMAFPRKNKKVIKEVASQFTAWYGFKTKPNKDEEISTK